MTYLLDTNVLSELIRPSPDRNVIRWIDSIDEDETFISVVTVAELHRGIKMLDAGKRKQQLTTWLRDDLLQRFETRILDITPRIAEAWSDLMVEAKRRGIGLHIMDAFIAASAKQHALNVVTRNVKDFESFSLSLTNPWRPHQ